MPLLPVASALTFHAATLNYAALNPLPSPALNRPQTQAIPQFGSYSTDAPDAPEMAPKGEKKPQKLSCQKQQLLGRVRTWARRTLMLTPLATFVGLGTPLLSMETTPTKQYHDVKYNRYLGKSEQRKTHYNAYAEVYWKAGPKQVYEGLNYLQAKPQAVAKDNAEMGQMMPAQVQADLQEAFAENQGRGLKNEGLLELSKMSRSLFEAMTPEDQTQSMTLMGNAIMQPEQTEAHFETWLNTVGSRYMTPSLLEKVQGDLQTLKTQSQLNDTLQENRPALLQALSRDSSRHEGKNLLLCLCVFFYMFNGVFKLIQAEEKTYQAWLAKQNKASFQ